MTGQSFGEGYWLFMRYKGSPTPNSIGQKLSRQDGDTFHYTGAAVRTKEKT